VESRAEQERRTGPITVWGAGAMGGTIGAHLARAGHDIRFVDTDQDHVAAIREKGLRITGPIADFVVQANAVTPDEARDPLSIVLLCVKAHHTPQAVRALASRLGPAGVVVSVQNGLNEYEIAHVVGQQRTFGCFVNFGADYLEPGVVHYGGRGTVAVGEVDGAMTPRAHAIHAVFLDFAADAILTDNIMGFLWSKLAYASLLFATALSDDGISDALARDEHRDVYVGLAREVVRVAHAEGIRLEPFDGFDPSAFTTDASPDAAARSLNDLVAHNRRSAKTHSGIWRDLVVRRRRTEIDAQIGPIVSSGRRHGIPTPLNQRLIEMIHEIEEGHRRNAVVNLDLLAGATA
jgi:2-dehydropantoate 2-reductase